MRRRAWRDRDLRNAGLVEGTFGDAILSLFLYIRGLCVFKVDLANFEDICDRADDLIEKHRFRQVRWPARHSAVPPPPSPLKV